MFTRLESSVFERAVRHTAWSVRNAVYNALSPGVVESAKIGSVVNRAL